MKQNYISLSFVRVLLFFRIGTFVFHITTLQIKRGDKNYRGMRACVCICGEKCSQSGGLRRNNKDSVLANTRRR